MYKVIVLDTETTNTIEDPIMYDIGWAVVDADSGEVLKTESYAVAEIFLDAEMMANAYFAEKIPEYWQSIKTGSRKLARLNTIRRTLRADCEAYGISEIYAHNARFDYRSCNLTQRYCTSSKYRFFFPYGVKVRDTLKMAKNAFKNCEDYKKFCEENEYKTQNNQLRFTAEILYRYLTNNNDFIESHTGLEDVLIEKEILVACRQRGVVDGALW